MLVLTAIHKRFSYAIVAVDGVDLSVAAGERLAVLGRSGCGKSTLLRVIAGLERADAGRIEIDGIDATDAAPHRRGVAMVMQSESLYPHLRVRANIEFALRMRSMDRAQIDRRVAEAAALLDIGDLLDRKPAELSGGERQRVSLARALAQPAPTLLLDEPFAALDAPLRMRLRHELRAILDQDGRTTVLVTHDQEEAIALGHRIAVMETGRILQIGTAEELLRSPASRRVAAFVGSPSMTFIAVTLRHDGTGWQASMRDPTAPWRIRLPRSLSPDVENEGAAILGLRGGLDWAEADGRDADEDDCGHVRGVVVGVERLGGHVDLRLRLVAGTEISVRRAPNVAAEVGSPMAFVPPASAFHLFRDEPAARGDGTRLRCAPAREGAATR